MQSLEIKDQIQLADILEQPIESLHIDLYQIYKRQRRFGRGGDDDEVQSSVVAVGDEGGDVVGSRGGGCGSTGAGEEGWQREKVTGSGGTMRDECKDFGDQALLNSRLLFDSNQC